MHLCFEGGDNAGPAGGGGAAGGPTGAGGPPGGGGVGGKGKFVKLYIPGPGGIKPTLGLKADLFQRARIGMPPDQFIIKSPGLNGIEGTYSFESVKYPMCYLQRVGRDIYLEALKRNQDFCKRFYFNSLGDFVEIWQIIYTSLPCFAR